MSKHVTELFVRTVKKGRIYIDIYFDVDKLFAYRAEDPFLLSEQGNL